MWVVKNGYAIQVSNYACILLDGKDIRFYHNPNKKPDVLSFSDDDAAENAFNQILKGINAGVIVLHLL